MYQKYFQAVKYVESFQQHAGSKNSVKQLSRTLFLKRFQYFLDLLGNPQTEQTFIHVSGSSGKGSVATMIAAIFTQAGYTTGVFTSPHCATTIERIKVNRLFISPAEFVKIINQLKPAIRHAARHSPYGQPSYFEIMTAAALIYFKQKKCDYVVLEVGLGGRFDATNIIARAAATVINLIDLDHVDILGKSLTAIAKEKAGIIKPGTVVFTTSANQPAVIKIFRQVAKKTDSPLRITKPPSIPYQLSLLGKHQQYNAALAAAVAKQFKISDRQIRIGLKTATLPCRFEIIKKNPYLIIAGAHNLSKINSTASALENLTYKKLYLIIALTAERNPRQIFKNLLPLAEKIFVTQFANRSRKKYSPATLAKNLNTNRPLEICDNISTALTKALKTATTNDVVLITGSFYLAGQTRNLIIPPNTILKNRHI